MTVTLYTRRGCHLCDDAKAVVLSAGRKVRFDYQEFDIDSDPGLRLLYGVEVPVIAIDGRKAFKYRLTEQELLRKLEARQ